MDSISFITPAFNCEKTIIETIESVFKGPFKEGDEYIIVNDCSSDKTRALIEKMQKKYPVTLINHKKNLGGAETRNTAVKKSKNNRIFCIDSDNLLDKKSFLKLRNYSDLYPKKTLCFEEIHYFRTTYFGIKVYSHKWHFADKKYSTNEYFTKKIVPGASGNYLFTKESWIKSGGYPKKSGALDTWGFGLRQVINGFNQFVVRDTFYNHRYGTESYYVRDSRKKNQLEKNRFKIISSVKEKIPPDIFKNINKNKYEWYEKVNL